MAHRTFRDRHGRLWNVYDVHPTMTERREPLQDQDVVIERRKHVQPRASLPVEMRNGWLAFESASERRRLAPTPEAWEQISEVELLTLLDHAVSAGKVKRLIE